ncbi:MAG: hypothetical protein AVDCRST_MAG14-2205, partial [uncultured Rubrobacteraceae bacterium]
HGRRLRGVAWPAASGRRQALHRRRDAPARDPGRLARHGHPEEPEEVLFLDGLGPHLRREDFLRKGL